MAIGQSVPNLRPAQAENKLAFEWLELSAKQLAGVGVGMLGMLLVVYWVTKPAPLPNAQNPVSTQGSNASSASTPNPLGEHLEDAHFWNVRSPDLTKVASEVAKQSAAGYGDTILVAPERNVLVQKGTSYPGGPLGGTQDVYQKAPAQYTRCDGKCENPIALKYEFYKQDDYGMQGFVLMKIKVEADFYYGTASSQNSCGGFRNDGRKVTEATYIWLENELGMKEWVLSSKARENPKFNKLMNDRQHELQMQESKKGLDQLEKEQKEREERKERYRAKRAAERNQTN